MTKLNSILMLIPSRNRPKALQECLTSLIDTGGGEGSRMDFTVLSGELSSEEGIISLFNSVPMQTIARYDIVGMCGDDCRFRTPAWDKLVVESLTARPGLLYGRDGIQDKNIATHPFVSTRMVLALGYVFPPCFKGLAADLALQEVADLAGCLYYEPQLFTEHLHWSQGKSEKDASAVKQEAWSARDHLALAQWRREDRLLAVDLVRKALWLKRYERV